jgi:hypothetical protein
MKTPRSSALQLVTVSLAGRSRVDPYIATLSACRRNRIFPLQVISPGTRRNFVISEGAPSRFGGPQ